MYAVRIKKDCGAHNEGGVTHRAAKGGPSKSFLSAKDLVAWDSHKFEAAPASDAERLVAEAKAAETAAKKDDKKTSSKK